MNIRIEKERKQEKEEKQEEEEEQEEEEGKLKVGREQGLRNDERGGGSMGNKRSEVLGKRRQESEGNEPSVVEESEGCDDDIEIIGGNVEQDYWQRMNKIIGKNVPETLNKTSYVQNWLKRSEVSQDDQLDESVEDIDKASTPDNTVEDPFNEKTGVESVVEEAAGGVGSDVETIKRKRGPSKTARAPTDENTDDLSKPVKKSRKYCCGQCEGFKRANCDACSACMDKPRNGGPNRLKKKCSSRACTA